MQQCPKCGSPRIHRSRSRSLVEHIRKAVTSKRPHRCHACGWRGWGAEAHDEPSLLDAPGPTRPALDLAVIDAFVVGKSELTRSVGSDAVSRDKRGQSENT